MPEPLLDNELARRTWEREELEQYAQDTQLMTSSMEGDSQESKVSVDAEEMRISEGGDTTTSIRMLSVDEPHDVDSDQTAKLLAELQVSGELNELSKRWEMQANIACFKQSVRATSIAARRPQMAERQPYMEVVMAGKPCYLGLDSYCAVGAVVCEERMQQARLEGTYDQIFSDYTEERRPVRVKGVSGQQGTNLPAQVTVTCTVNNRTMRFKASVMRKGSTGNAMVLVGWPLLDRWDSVLAIKRRTCEFHAFPDGGSPLTVPLLFDLTVEQTGAAVRRMHAGKRASLSRGKLKAEALKELSSAEVRRLRHLTPSKHAFKPASSVTVDALGEPERVPEPKAQAKSKAKPRHEKREAVATAPAVPSDKERVRQEVKDSHINNKRALGEFSYMGIPVPKAITALVTVAVLVLAQVCCTLPQGYEQLAKFSLMRRGVPMPNQAFVPPPLAASDPRLALNHGGLFQTDHQGYVKLPLKNISDSVTGVLENEEVSEVQLISTDMIKQLYELEPEGEEYTSMVGMMSAELKSLTDREMQRQRQLLQTGPDGSVPLPGRVQQEVEDLEAQLQHWDGDICPRCASCAGEHNRVPLSIATCTGDGGENHQICSPCVREQTSIREAACRPTVGERITALKRDVGSKSPFIWMAPS